MSPPPSSALARVVETLVIGAPLGIMLRDVATGRIVDEDLDVWATIPDRPSAPVPLVPNRSGVFVLSRLPGRPQVVVDEDGDLVATPVLRVRVSVTPRRGSYVAWSLLVDLPHRGLFGLGDLAASSPPGSPPTALDRATNWLPLFPGPSSPAPSGMAVVRADLVGPDDEPASYAVVEVTPPGPASEVKTWIGVADAHGRVAVHLPWPPPALVVSPPSSPPGPPQRERWTLSVRFRYAAPTSPPADPSIPPDLVTLLNQPPVDALESASPPVQLEHPVLTYGSDLVLATDGRDNGALALHQ